MVGCGRLKLDLKLVRNDTPDELKHLIAVCSDYDRDKRYNFVEVSSKKRPARLTSNDY
jgi:hypothetical protein